MHWFVHLLARAENRGVQTVFTGMLEENSSAPPSQLAPQVKYYELEAHF